jgi:hypothetical protein
MFHFKENKPDEKANFGIDIEPENKYVVIRTFFARTGHLQVFCVPYLAGQHRVTNGEQGYRLATTLKKLNLAGLVHGDIRGYNTINGADDSYLIDFDFGGEENVVKYPPDNNFLLPDGKHVSASLHISQADDVYALGQWPFFFNKTANLLKNAELAFAFLGMQEAIGCILLKDADPRRTKAEQVLDEMIKFFRNYRHEKFEVDHGRVLTEPDAARK